MLAGFMAASQVTHRLSGSERCVFAGFVAANQVAHRLSGSESVSVFAGFMAANQGLVAVSSGCCVFRHRGSCCSCFLIAQAAHFMQELWHSSAAALAQVQSVFVFFARADHGGIIKSRGGPYRVSKPIGS